MSSCPLCGSNKAYLGMNTIECNTVGCSNFSIKQVPDSAVPSYFHMKVELRILKSNSKTTYVDIPGKITAEDIKEIGAAFDDFNNKVNTGRLSSKQPNFGNPPQHYTNIVCGIPTMHRMTEYRVTSCGIRNQIGVPMTNVAKYVTCKECKSLVDDA